jgi:hypothetical protein
MDCVVGSMPFNNTPIEKNADLPVPTSIMKNSSDSFRAVCKSKPVWIHVDWSYVTALQSCEGCVFQQHADSHVNACTYLHLAGRLLNLASPRRALVISIITYLKTKEYSFSHTKITAQQSKYMPNLTGTAARPRYRPLQCKRYVQGFWNTQ